MRWKRGGQARSRVKETCWARSLRRAPTSRARALGWETLSDWDEGDDHYDDGWSDDAVDEPDREGPSAADIQQFGDGYHRDDVAYCPSCKMEVWHDADRCPHCGNWVAIDEAWENSSMGRWPYVLVVVLVIILSVMIAMW